jgi:hypothetical protein
VNLTKCPEEKERAKVQHISTIVVQVMAELERRKVEIDRRRAVLRFAHSWFLEGQASMNRGEPVLLAPPSRVRASWRRPRGRRGGRGRNTLDGGRDLWETKGLSDSDSSRAVLRQQP